MWDEGQVNIFVYQVILANNLKTAYIPGVENFSPVDRYKVTVVSNFSRAARGGTVTQIDGFDLDAVGFSIYRRTCDGVNGDEHDHQNLQSGWQPAWWK